MSEILPIVIHPDSVLRQKCEAVTEITPDIIKLMNDMLDTMYDAEGIGLAAPQVGIAKRIIVLDVEQSEDAPGRPLKMINPEIIAASEEKTILEEGCLSLPTMRVDVARPESVTVRYIDENGVTLEVEASDLFAKCVQHEIDHLNGVLIFDYQSKLKRDMTLRKYEKNRRIAMGD